MQPDEQTVARSLASALVFADKVLPLLVEAFDHAVSQVRDVPPGGIANLAAQLQALPSLLRLNLIQLVEGSNAVGGERMIRRKGSPNNGLWLGLAGQDMMARVYKNPSRYPITPSGFHQERLIRQDRYHQLLMQPPLNLDIEARQLDALLLWDSKEFDLLGASVVIPNGWDEQGKIVELAREPIPVDVIGDLAQFMPISDHITLLGGPIPILTEGYDAELADIRVNRNEEFLSEDQEATFDGSEASHIVPSEEEDADQP